MTWPKSFTKLLGSESLGSKRKLEHLRMRAAIARCLGPQALKNYMFKMSFEIQHHIIEKWKGKSQVKMVPLVKELIFSLAASLFFGVSNGAERTRLHHLFETVVAASFAVTLEFPGTRFYREIKDGEEISWTDLNDMKYTWQAAQETLRMNPPHFGTFREAITDIDYKGYTIPKGWKILWTVYSTHTKEEYFSETDKFKPSRFEEGSSNVAPYTYLPFAAG
ncbi:hypothetical protein SUGI_0693520 [Cryptomeria japonica]|nr:hypothetical protein SUGI_0693520 [Cryptomeria japonica]